MDGVSQALEISVLQLTVSLAIIISAGIAAVTAVIIARQVVHMKRSREVDTFLKVLEAGNQSSLRQASDWVKYEMDPDFTYEIARLDREAWGRVSTVLHHFEMIGVLVEHGHVSARLVYDQMGPWIVGTWAKLEPLIQAHRSHRRAPDYCENFEILASQFDQWAVHNPAKLEKRSRISHDAVRQYYR